MTTEELCAEIERLDAAAPPYAAKQMELLIQAARIDPILRGAAIDVETAMLTYAELIASYRTLAVEAAKKLREMQRREAILTNAIGNREFMRGIYDAMDAAESGEVGKTLAQIKSELDADGELLVNKYAQDKIRAVKREAKE